jgi:hypothetical protein
MCASEKVCPAAPEARVQTDLSRDKRDGREDAPLKRVVSQSETGRDGAEVGRLQLQIVLIWWLLRCTRLRYVLR